MDVTWYLENGCELQHPDPIMLRGIYEATGGSPCRECHCKDTCPAWRKLGTMSLREQRITPLRAGVEKINTLADQLIQSGQYSAIAVNKARLQALNEVFKVELKASGDLAMQLMSMPLFLEGCRQAGVEPTRRQANKCLREEGLVWQTLRQMAQAGTLPPRNLS